VLFVLTRLPVIAGPQKARRSTGISSALIGAALEARVPLPGQMSWQVLMRVGNVLELTRECASEGSSGRCRLGQGITLREAPLSV
jgi:hypothetical protein